MKQDLFKFLPSEIISNILSRLDVRTIASSKCVCKPWLDLLETDYFVNSHLAKSVPSLAVMIRGCGMSCCKVVEYEDELESHDFRYNEVTKFYFPKKTTIMGAANGLLLLKKVDTNTNNDILYICNPITRHYVEIPGPENKFFSGKCPPLGQYGFGASRISGQHKVVGIIGKLECYVYTLGTGSWRRIAVEAARLSLVWKFYDYIFSAFVDGHLYWTVKVTESSPLISCFDLETECFTSFNAPALRGELSVLSGCLCFCEGKAGEIVVWLMKEYGVEKSWSKYYVITQSFDYHCNGNNIVYPIKVLKNGDMLVLRDDVVLVYYFNKTKTIKEVGLLCNRNEVYIRISSIPLTPSFLSLKGLGMENVISF